VRPVIDRYKLAEGVDWMVAYTYDLEQEDTCAAKKEAVEHLRALADPRGIAALERVALRRVVKSGPKPTKVYAYPCLVEDAKSAIGALNGLKAKGKP
jgi:hypothetical protein